MPTSPLIDPFGRRIRYLRVSVTDRCDLRCVYCMAERQTFLPRDQVLSLDQLDRLCSTFIDLGTRRLRLSGGEPLTRPDFLPLVQRLSRHLASGALDEITLTTNGTRLALFADDLAAVGVRRVNVSLDHLDPDEYRRITRGGDLGRVLDGIAAAQAAGLTVKINTVALKQDNADHLAAMITWAHERGMALTLIEAMPLGDVGTDRSDQFLSLAQVRADLERSWTLSPTQHEGAGPARYWRVAETGGVLGLISPISASFCAGCDRVRMTCTGRLYPCLGRDNHTDLRPLLGDDTHPTALADAIREGVAAKPLAHAFPVPRRGDRPSVARPMSMTGG